MAVDPEFFTKRATSVVLLDPARDLSRAALLAAIDAALAEPSGAAEAAEHAIRVLGKARTQASAEATAGLSVATDRDSFMSCLGQPVATWLPHARELGIDDERLMFFGLPTWACWELKSRLP